MDPLKSSISATRAVFDIQNDLNLLDSISQNIAQLDTARSTELATRKRQIVQLGKQKAALEASIAELRANTQMKQAKRELIDLENRMFKIAGNLTALNMELNSLKLTYNQDVKKLDELEQQLEAMKNFQGEVGEESAERLRAIKLKLYESLGLRLSTERKEVMVLNKRENKTNVLKVDEKYSEYFVSNYVWENM